jgi:hypothetical protein
VTGSLSDPSMRLRAAANSSAVAAACTRDGVQQCGVPQGRVGL